MNRWQRIVVCGLVSVLLVPSAMFATDQIGVAGLAQSPPRWEAVGDSFTNRARPRRTFGGRRSMKVGISPRRRSYVAFDLSEIDRPIASVTLLLYARSPGPKGLTVREVDGPWREERINHRNAPGRGEVIGRHPKHVSNRWLLIDVTEATKQADGVLDVALVSRAKRGARYATRESRKTPHLQVSFVGEETASPSPTPPNSPTPTPSASSPQHEPIRVAVGADIACDPESSNFNGGAGTANTCRMRSTSDLIVAGNYDGVLIPGDLQYENGALWKFNESYDPTWGRVKEITYPVPGNHEYGTANASGYFDYFGARAGDPARGYYDFTLGAWHVIALNSNCEAVGGCHSGSDQEQWLRARLAAVEATCTLAYWHHPRFSSGGHGSSPSTAAFWDALYEHDADVILVGHEHFYERFAAQDPDGEVDPGGIVQFIVGTGGKSLYGFTTVHPNSVERNNHTYGILELILRDGGYDFDFVPADGTYDDSGTGVC